MDLYVRIPATNMHDVGIQTIPSDTSNEGHPLRKEEHLGFQDNQKQVLTDHKDKDRPTSLPNQISSQCDPATLTLRMGESEWCIERSTPRKASETPSLSPQETRGGTYTTTSVIRKTGIRSVQSVRFNREWII